MLLGRLPEAHVSLDTAQRYHRRYSPNGLGLSIVALVRAGVFYEQGQLQDAMVLAERSEVGFAHLGEEKRRMDAVFLRAAILFEAGRAAEAIPLFRQVIEYGETVDNIRLIGRGSYATGDCQLALGNLGEASAHYHRALVIFREVGPRPDLVATEWGLARVVLRGGKYADAIVRLRAVATAFEQLNLVTDAALVGLDIIEAFLAMGKPRRIIALAQHLFSIFTNAGILTGALAAIAYLKEAATTGELTPAGLDEVRSFLRRAERQPSLQFVRPRPHR
jgi:tetratricopeptide (TPR) repeat protein